MINYRQLGNEVILCLFMKLIHLLKIFLRNITNPSMNVTEFFQPHHSKVTFPFIQSPQFQNFPSLYNIEIFKKLIDILCEGSCSDSKSAMITGGERFTYLQLNSYATTACGEALSKFLSVVMHR